MPTSTATSSSLARTAAPRRGPLAPRVATCEPQRRAKLLAAYQTAYRWVQAAAGWLKRWMKSPSLRREWNAGVVGRLFGPFRVPRLRKLIDVVRGVLERFTRGYAKGGKAIPTTLMCFPATYHRCRTGLLGNANIFGTLRFCPRLQFAKIRRRIKRLRRWLTSKGARFVLLKEEGGRGGRGCSAHRGKYGYTLAPVVYLCPRWFTFTLQGRAGALIHELTHRLVQPGAAVAGIAALVATAATGFVGTAAAGSAASAAIKTYVYAGHPIVAGRRVTSDDQADRAARLARRRPLAARRSPVNWRLLFEELATGVRATGG